MTQTDISNWLVAIGTMAGVLIAFAAATLGMTLRAYANWIRLNARVVSMESDLVEHINDFKETVKSMYQSMREDRKATNDRLTYLERERMQK